MKFTTIFLFFCSSILAQPNYPRDYFRSPLDIPIQLSGNFGELRYNHFHAGFDFKTMQKEGLNVYAAADGYISRIKISTFGNGKTIYVTHPNGYTTVYGHLQRAIEPIESYIKKAQYNDQAYEIELFPKIDELLVYKGDVIAFSGNTGGSEGPHLHFEIRDSKTEKIINPFYFGFDSFIKDTKKPVVLQIVGYPIDANSVLNKSARAAPLNLVLEDDGNFHSENVYAKGKIGFGIQGYDVVNYSYEKYGFFKLNSFLNGATSFEIEWNTFSFDETKYVNAFIDYSHFKKTKQRIEKLFMQTPFPLSIIHSNADNGIITVTPNFSAVYRIEVSDFCGNTSTITIPIQYAAAEATLKSTVVKTPYFIKSKVESNFEKDNYSVFFPVNTFYDDFYIDFEVKNKIMTLHNDAVPIQKSFQITMIDSTAIADEKTFIASIENNKLGFNSTKRKGFTFTCYSRNLGQFIIARDTVPPKIILVKPIKGKWITSQQTIELNISDTLSGIKSYNGYLNGKWTLFEYENKTGQITHYFNDGIVAEGKNDLKIEVTDNVGNSTIFETQFFRSQK